MRTLPHLPSTVNGMLCVSEHAQSKCQQPRATLITLSLAFLFAFSRDGRVSFDFPIPNPTCPFLSPTTAIDEKVRTFPSIVFFCVCLHARLFPPPNLPLDCPTKIRSFSKVIKPSTISGSRILLLLNNISSISLILPFLTSLPI